MKSNIKYFKIYDLGFRYVKEIPHFFLQAI